MIEKLSEYRIKSRDGGAFINVECNTKIINTLVQKINELVEAVNATQNLWLEVAITKKKIFELHPRAENVQPNIETRVKTVQDELDRTRKVLGDTIKLAEQMLESIQDEGMCSSYYEDTLNKIKSITKGGDNE